MRDKELGDDPGKLTLEHNCWLVSEDSKMKYPIRDGIPVMLIEEGDKYQEIKSAKNKALAADRKRMARLGEVEDRISELEAALEKLGKKLASPPDIPDQVAALGHEYREAETELEILINEWESLQNEIGGRTE